MERYGDWQRLPNIPFDVVANIMRASVPYGEFSTEFTKSMQICTSNFLKELTKKCMEIKSLDQREALDTSDIWEALKNLDLHKIQPQRDPTTDEGGSNTETEEFLKPAILSLYKQNQGPSKHVKDWVQSHPNLVMNVCLGSAIMLKRIVSCLKESGTQSEVNFQFTKDMITAQSLGPQNVSLLSVHLRSTAFESFLCSKPILLGLNLTGLDQFLKQATKNDQITILYADEAKECTLILEDDCHATVFTMKLKMFESHYFQPTNVIHHAVEFLMPAQVFQKTCRDLKGFLKTDTVTITCQSEMGVSFVGEGTFGNLRIDFENPMISILGFKKPCSVSFSLPYLCRFAKAPLSPSVNIKIGEDMALMCVYEIQNIGDVHFYLAPKLVET